MANIQKINACLWFNNEAEDAAKFYTSIFKDSKIGAVSHYGKAGKDVHQMPEGSVMTVEFELLGQRFLALNGGPVFKFNEAISFVINCKNQEEIDYYWEKLNQGGDPKSQQCGWLKDKFGLSWQVVPDQMSRWSGAGGEKSERVMNVLLNMKKLDIKKLEKAYKGEGELVS